MLPNEVFALACRAHYEEQGLIVDKTNGEFAHCPLPKGMGETGYYLLWEHHQQQGLLQSRDVGKCCFYNPHALQWLLTCDYFPNNFFDLWDIYEEYCGENAARMRDKPAYGTEEWRENISRGVVNFMEKIGSEEYRNICIKGRIALGEKHGEERIKEWGMRGSLVAAEKRKKWVKATTHDGREFIAHGVEELRKIVYEHKIRHRGYFKEILAGSFSSPFLSIIYI